MTVIIALDVDGVINAFDEDPAVQGVDDYRCFKASPGPNAWGGYERKYTIQWSPTIVNRLMEMHTGGKAEIRWLTTWGKGANGELSAGMALPGDFIVVGEKPANAAFTPLDTHSVSDEQDNWWKFTYMKRLTNENPDARIVWLDDDLQFDPAAWAWVAWQKDRVLGISPNTNFGLTLEQIELIQQFIDRE